MSCWKETIKKNNKVKCPTEKQFKTQTMQTKNGIKNERR